MKIGELLRQLADLADAEDAEDAEAASGLDLGQLNASGKVPNVSIGPLQQAHELLKKSTGVDNEVDAFAADDDAEIVKMQHNAGIPQQPIVINQTFEINAAPAAAPIALPATPAPEPAPEISTTSESQFVHPRKPTSKSKSIKAQFGTSRAPE